MFDEFEPFDLDAELELIPTVELEPGQTDPRYLRVSYSSLLDFHACPRFFQLKKLKLQGAQDQKANVTFSFGHAMGLGIQEFLTHRDLDKAIWAMFMEWDVDYLAENETQKKSFPEAVAALETFAGLCDNGLLEDYEVAYFNGKPAAELSFCIDFGVFKYRGYVDLVLEDKTTGELLILELKTSSANAIWASSYKNSAQAIGYSVVLDRIKPGCTSYSVLYLAYMTKLRRYEVFEFPKTLVQRVHWIKNTLWDQTLLADMVSNFGNYGVWPQHGESCRRFGRDCEFLDSCHLATERVMSPVLETDLVEETEYDFYFTVEELLTA